MDLRSTQEPSERTGFFMRGGQNSTVRRLFFFASLLSLLLCVATAVLWMRSFRRSYAFGGTAPGVIYSGSASRGRISVSLASLSGTRFSFYSDSATPPWELRTYGWAGKLGFWVDTRPGAKGNSRIAIVVPTVVPVALSTVLPLAWGVRRIWKKRSKGSCPECSYNLTGNISGVCPECGTVVKNRSLLSD
jgi:hypothetical protein